jgi:hypothetical protein
MKFEIQIQKAEALPGTVKWVEDQLKDAKPEIGKTGAGRLAMKVKLGYLTKFVCLYESPTGGYMNIEKNGRIYNRIANWGGNALFNTPLTPKAEKIVEEFIDKCLDKLVEFVEDN